MEAPGRLEPIRPFLISLHWMMRHYPPRFSDMSKISENIENIKYVLWKSTKMFLNGPKMSRYTWANLLAILQWINHAFPKEPIARSRTIDLSAAVNAEIEPLHSFIFPKLDLKSPYRRPFGVKEDMYIKAQLLRKAQVYVSHFCPSPNLSHGPGLR